MLEAILHKYKTCTFFYKQWIKHLKHLGMYIRILIRFINCSEHQQILKKEVCIFQPTTGLSHAFICRTAAYVSYLAIKYNHNIHLKTITILNCTLYNMINVCAHAWERCGGLFYLLCGKLDSSSVGAQDLVHLVAPSHAHADLFPLLQPKDAAKKSLIKKFRAWTLSVFFIFSTIKNDFAFFFFKLTYFCASPIKKPTPGQINSIKNAQKSMFSIEKMQNLASSRTWVSLLWVGHYRPRAGHLCALKSNLVAAAL